MIVKCVSNTNQRLSKEQLAYALPRSNSLQLDVSLAKYYVVYGVMGQTFGLYYLVHTDIDNTESYWWMPAVLYEVTDATKPAHWKYYKDQQSDNDFLETFDSYFDYKVSGGIEDNDKQAILKFNKQVDADGTMPCASRLRELNLPFQKAKAQTAYHAALRLSRERGYQRPALPDILSDQAD